jgi:DNA-binding GntR family transcriptional regulator
MPNNIAAAVEETAAISLKERAYKTIKQNIISCKFPPGSLLNEKDLVAEIGVSRTPIREALNRLEQEKLVTIVPQRGSFVTEITPQIIKDVYQVREMLEPCLVSRVTPLVTAEDLKGFRERFSRLVHGDYEAAMAVDDDFHNFIVKASGNDYLINLMENLYVQNERIRAIMIRMPQRLGATVDEHQAVIEAMLAGDGVRAGEAMRSHIISAMRLAFKFITGLSADIR